MYRLVLSASLAALACQSAKLPQPYLPSPPLDPHSFSVPEHVRVTHIDLDLTLDFAVRRVTGTAMLALERLRADEPLILDSQGLVIEAVRGADGTLRRFELGRERPRFGQPLRIDLDPGDERVTIAYHTRPDAEALQWLAPEQTADGEEPFLFTQGQAILTRTWIPLQDSPGVRVTYAARVHAPEPLTVVMSAEGKGRDPDGAWRFALARPVPPYLIALACGKLASRELSERVRVWAEPGVVEAAAWEFADTETMVQSAEQLFGPYRWGRYDVLILPPAFPYGGMENPLLTFLTPTVIAGDRSLVDIIAHELAHSWSGNLVTNATWSDFWLNEGTTVYFERRIMEQIYGPERMRTQAALDMRELRKTIVEKEPWQSVLAIDLAGRHPDDGFSVIPYHKGAAFLHRLEEVFGRETFDAFLRAWFDEHAFQSVTTQHFESFLAQRLLRQHPERAEQVEVRQWLHAPGLPASAPEFPSDALARVDTELQRLARGALPGELDCAGWSSQQWEHFVEGLPSYVELAPLDEAFGFTASGNSEVLSAWLERAIRAGYAAADARLEEFLMTVGRRKYLQPLYEALLEVDPERARALYARARPRYHAVSTQTLDALLAEESAAQAR